MIAQNLIIIARNIKSIAVEDCDGDYYPREIRVPGYFKILKQQKVLSENSSP